MSAQLLATELHNLITESKRKHQDLRQAAEKSLEEIKSLRVSEAQFGAELSQRINFVNPFIIACGTKNAKFTGIAIVCLQRLIVSKALPRSKLSPVLEALREATSAGLDVQLKILQALPSLLQNYSTDIRDDLLVTALNICFILQSSKNAIVNNTSAATLQQLIVSVFEKVVAEDKSSYENTVGEAPVDDGVVQLKAAALDAYRIFNDLCLLTQSQRPEYLRFSGLPQTFGLELIESALTNHAAVFATHPEQVYILRTKVLPFIIQALSGRPHFAASVRLFRILYTLLKRHLTLIPKESGEALDILTHILDQDTTIWKRSLCMEVFRGIFAEPTLVRRIFRMFDAKEGEKDVLKNLVATFVRVSTEKPVVIGLGHQSTIPVANPYSTSADQAVLDASGVSVSVIAGSVGGAHDTGISTQWSSMRVPCIDQLDKTDPPPIPESYVYSLTLACITSLSEGLAKFILPLTVPGERSRRRGKPGSSIEGGGEDRPDSPASLERSASFKKNPISVNPLLLKDHPLYLDVETCALIIDECWPAILATCSTFLYAALDSEYYHGLVRAFQRFAHVAGLLQLTTPRDAFLTTLGKAAVPPNVFTACLNAGQPRQPAPSPASETPTNSILSNARGLLSVESLVSQSTAEKTRPQSFDASSSALNTRNLLCLRALLNLGIALGPTLAASWQIVLESLQQADFVLFATGKTAGRTPIAAKGPDPTAEKEANALLANFGSEIKAVETATSRLFESTVDFPNHSFLEVVNAVCSLLEKRPEPETPLSGRDSRPETIPENSTSNLPSPTSQHRRMPNISTMTGPVQADQFALAKLGDLASINLERLLGYPPDVSGWKPLVSELNAALSATSLSAPVRARAAEILVRLILEAANAAAVQPRDVRGTVQLRLFEAFRDALLPLQSGDRELSVAIHSTDVEIHRVILEGLKSILENCGESLVSGWDIIFDIIDSIFIDEVPASDGRQAKTSLTTRSIKLIKASFGALQLICSDFLSSLPNACFLQLVDTLYKFCSQDDDLNVALTTVTFFWAISDFLSEKSNSMSITEDMVDGVTDEALVRLASHPDEEGSSAALWMLLLLRLTAVTADQRLELRNSAIQTLLRIIHAYGSSLGPQAWTICVKYVIFKLLSSIETRLQSVREENVEDNIKSEWNETAVVIVQGISNLLASYMEVLATFPAFTALWQDLISHFATMLDFHALDINTATFSSLRGILLKCEEGSNSSFDRKTIDLAWDLWSRGIPIGEQSESGQYEDSQKCLISWVEGLLELYRLIQIDLTVDRVKRMLSLLRDAMQQAKPGSYASDIEYVTPLQGRILDVFKLVRTDIHGVPSAMISQVADFVALAFDKKRAAQPAASKRTYIAMSKESMDILQYHVLSNATDADIYVSGAFANALTALSRPVILKYDFPIITKSEQPWKKATTTALALLESTLPQVKAAKTSKATIQKIWDVVVSISNGIITANYDNASTGADIAGDQVFDINSFRALRELIIPSLGSESISDTTRRVYADGLFRTSIVHAPAPSEAEIVFANGNEGSEVMNQALAALYRPRNGRTIDSKPTKRNEMSYVCLDELFDIVSAHDPNAAGPEITLQPPTPRFPPPSSSAAGPPDPLKSPVPDTTSGGAAKKHRRRTNGVDEPAHELYVRLARTAAPYLILRCALTLRAYVADQPLRGRMPQPLSQRRELERILSCLIELQSDPKAIPGFPRIQSEKARHLYRLYPMLVKAAMVNPGDDKIVRLVTTALEVVGIELGLGADMSV